MTSKKINEEEVFTLKECNDVIDNVFTAYIMYFQDGRMTAQEFALVENILIKIQNGFKELR